MNICASPRSAARIAASLAAVALVCGGLTACFGGAESPSPSPSSDVEIPEPVQPTASGTPPVLDEATAVTIGCEQLVTPQELYDFNPNYSHLDSYTPAAGTDAAAIVAAKGVACGWVNNTSSELIVIAVARPGEASLAAITAELAASGTAVDAFGPGGHFSGNQAEVVQGGFWVVATSNDFYSAADAQPLVTAALAHLG